ncbi:MAG: thiamine-phosphate kinase [Pseudomonadota bacterium]
MGAPDDEFRLIADLFAPLAAGFPGALGLQDDAALLPGPPGTDTVVTVDAIVAGVHFLPDAPPEEVARRLVRVNVSDLAAKGARPVAALLAAAFPKDADADWLRRFATALGDDLRLFGMALAGGDTVATPGPLTLSLTAFGQVGQGRAILRSGARAGDGVWVSGTIGDAALGLLVATGRLAADAILEDRFRLPRPRVETGPALVGIASAGMDVSDGLVQDLGHICRASGLAATIRADLVPLSDAARAAIGSDHSLLATALTGGDDYELLFTAPPEQEDAIAAVAAATGTALTRIGAMAVGEGVAVVDGDGTPLALGHGGWRHF